MKAVASECHEAASNNTISIRTAQCNVISKSQVQEAMDAADQMASETYGSKSSILVNCAGITRDAKVSNISDKDWEDVLGVNLKGTFHACQVFCDIDRVANLLKSGNGGSIINVGSIVSGYGNVGQCNYAASKGGVVGLTRSLAKEMALLAFNVAHGNDTQSSVPAVRVNCIQPGERCCAMFNTITMYLISLNNILMIITSGFIETPMAHAVPDRILSELKKKIALRRLGSPEDVANLCCFLASSERSGYITGEVIECSGMLRL